MGIGVQVSRIQFTLMLHTTHPWDSMDYMLYTGLYAQYAIYEGGFIYFLYIFLF